MATDANKERKRVYTKSKHESEGNIATFFGLGAAAQAILKSNVKASHISHKSRTKAVVKYDYDGTKPSSDDQSNIESLLNQMISKKTLIKCSKLNDLPSLDDIAEGMDHNSSQLYQIAIQDSITKKDYIAISHIQLPDDLGFLKDFKIIKFNVKKNKLQIQFQIGGDTLSTDKNVQSNAQANEAVSDEKSNQIVNKVARVKNFRGENNAPIAMQFSQDIVDQMLFDLKSDLNVQLSESKLEQLVSNTYQKLNQFQNITYTRAVSSLLTSNKQE